MLSSEYRKGSSLHIADSLSRTPLATTFHKQVHDEVAYRVEFESTTPDLPGFRDTTLRYIRAAASLDPDQIALHSWPNEVVAVLAQPYWSIRN